MASDKRRLIILGVTGTVGVQALEILDQNHQALELCGLSAHAQSDALNHQATTRNSCVTFLTSDQTQRQQLLDFLADGDNYDICLNAVVGAAGLPFSVAVLAAGKDLALANKESLVCAGEIISRMADQFGGKILPVDSEHAAIAQCLTQLDEPKIRKLILTASGGALRDLPLNQLGKVTPAQALAHPNWEMGPRITIDSATMMNKVLEIIEAQHLFNISSQQIEVSIHRQSIVHSMVEFVDGSVLAQMGPPDMKYPIHWALHYPERQATNFPGFSPDTFNGLTFESPDPLRYPMLAIGAEACRLGGAAGAVLNAADEIAVAAFLEHRIAFDDITSICEQSLNQLAHLPASTLEEIFAADQEARSFAANLMTTPTK